jgi:enoyl-[acyl-carrier protein] reductase I
MSKPLEGKRAFIVGVANERSLAWYIAQHLHNQGAELAFSYWGEKMEKRVRPLAESVGSKFIEDVDVSSDADIEDAFKKLNLHWDSLDILVHSVAFANREDLEGRFVETSRDGFRLALDISAYSLLPLSRAAERMMKNRGTILTLTYEGANRLVPNYNVMGVAKAALEATVRYLAYDLGSKRIRVNSISAGPVKTLAAAGIRDFRKMLETSIEKTPLKENISGDDVGALAAFLCGPGGTHITGSNMYVDSGAHIV